MWRIWCKYPKCPEWHWWDNWQFAVDRATAEILLQHCVIQSWGGEGVLVAADVKHGLE